MKWLFGYGSPVTLGVMRIVVGGLASLSLALLFPVFDSFYTEAGFYPLKLAQVWAGDFPRLTVLGTVTDPGVGLFVLSLTLAAGILTTLGLFSRVSSAVLAVGLISLHHRSPEVLNSGDTLLRLLCVYVALSPSGAACSLDRLIGLWRGTAPAEPPEVSLWPQRLMAFQVAVVYFMTFWAKMQGDTWRDGTATWYPTQLREFDRFPVPAFLDQQPFLAITTYYTLAIELALGTLVFHRAYRKWVLLGGLLLHAGIEWRFNIPLFAWTICGAYVAFYDGEEIRAWARRFGARWWGMPLVVALPVGMGLRPRHAAVLRAADPFGWVRFEPGGRPWKPGDLGLLLRLPGLWGLFLWPPAWAKLMTGATEPLPGGVEMAKSRR